MDLPEWDTQVKTRTPAERRRQHRPIRLILVASAATGLIAVAIAFNLGAVSWPPGHGSPASPTNLPPRPSSGQPVDDYSVMGEATISGHTFPAARLSEPETRFFEQLIAAGVSVQRVEPFDQSRSVYAEAVIHRVMAAPSWSFVEATSLVLPFQGTACSRLAQPGYRYRIVLAGFSQELSDDRPIRFGFLFESVVWSTDSASWDQLVKAGAHELSCPSA